MDTQHLAISHHAHQRSAQRNLREDEIDFIATYGRRMRRTGAIFCQLLRSDIPDDLPANHSYRRLVGSTVVLSRCGQYVLTVYRDEKAFRRDSRKEKFRRNRADREIGASTFGEIGAA
ncbi:MAG: DUF4258 domain-containing protein [Chitinophagaceae bacterium]|nr:DUF4258 domain-containing protein [Anaerolineae bacterium]